jgi:error-prone DNA polymerase
MTVAALLDQAAHLGMPALALTDHNTMAGAVSFVNQAMQSGIKPILGCELNLEGDYHLILLVKELKGYHNLCRLLTLSHLSSLGGPPQVTRELLARHSDGLIALAGFRCGEISKLVSNYRDDEALVAANFHREIYGKDFYLEVFRGTDGAKESSLRRLVAFARKTQIPIVATNAVHYMESKDAATALLREAIANQAPLPRFHVSKGSDRSLLSGEVMVHRFADLPEALAATQTISEQCGVPWPSISRPFLDSEGLSGAADDEELTRLTYQTSAERCSAMSQDVCSRIQEELAVIRQMGMAWVFLLAHHFASICQEKGIRFQLRGSAVNSQVLFALGVNNVESLNHNLMFERFLHPNKQHLPDLDIEVQRSCRLEVRDLLIEKYGSDRVATLGTIANYNARSLLRDAAPVLGLPKDAAFGALEGVYGQRLKDLLFASNDRDSEFRGNRLLRHPRVRQVLERCVGLDGLPYAISAHPSGLVIGPPELERLIPLQTHEDGQIITQYPAESLEHLGIFKIDLLSSPTLDVLQETKSLVNTTQSDVSGFETMDDSDVFAMHRSGETIGCFQVETPLQRELAARLQPAEFQDLVILLALGRPGPMRSRLHEEYLRRRNLPEHGLDDSAGGRECLDETYGVLLYQEQVLEIPRQMASFSYMDADALYGSLTQPQRSKEELSAFQDRFLTGATSNGIDRDTSLAVWRNLSQVAAYSFAKGHATAYAGLAYEALWQKYYHPLEFLCALLNHQPCGSYPVRVLVMEARRLEIGLAPLDINTSAPKWTVEPGTLRVGLRQLKGMTDAALRRILLAKKDRYFRCLEDFVARTWLPGYLIENLVLVGAFDSLETDRNHLLDDLSLILRRRRKGGRVTLGFPGRKSSAAVQPASSRRDTMIWEFGLLGFCSTATPFEFLQDEIGELTPLELLGTTEPGEMVRVAGSVVRRHTSTSRNGQPTRFFTIEDGTGLGNIVLFSNVQTESAGSLQRASWLLVAGTVQERGPGGRSILASMVEPL